MTRPSPWTVFAFGETWAIQDARGQYVASVLTKDLAELIAREHNAMDVIRRRDGIGILHGWSGRTGFHAAWRVNALPPSMPPCCHDLDPCAPLLEAEEWYKANVDQGGSQA